MPPRQLVPYSTPETSTSPPKGSTGDTPENEYRSVAEPLVAMLNTVPNPPVGPVGVVGTPPNCVVPTSIPALVSVSSDGELPSEPPKYETVAKLPAELTR